MELVQKSSTHSLSSCSRGRAIGRTILIASSHSAVEQIASWTIATADRMNSSSVIRSRGIPRRVVHSIHSIFCHGIQAPKIIFLILEQIWFAFFTVSCKLWFGSKHICKVVKYLKGTALFRVLKVSFKYFNFCTLIKNFIFYPF